MKVLKISIQNFRAIKSCEIYPSRFNVLLGPNNIGKTTILEALSLLLNPDAARSDLIDENDFYRRHYLTSSTQQGTADAAASASGHPESQTPEAKQPPTIIIEAVLGPIEQDEDKLLFERHLVPWDPEKKAVIESGPEGEDPFGGSKVPAVWICFHGQYSSAEDEFVWRTYFKKQSSDVWEAGEDTLPSVRREHRLRLGFLIYRDFRATQRPHSLDASSLITKVLESQGALPRQFEEAFGRTKNVLEVFHQDADFARVMREIAAEMGRYLSFPKASGEELFFELTDRTRRQFRSNAQLSIKGSAALPLQKFGAGTRSIVTLSLLTYILRKRGRGILALEEPETFLFPHAQRRIVAEAKSLASQLFVTTHSPYVLEQFDVSEICRISVDEEGVATQNSINKDAIVLKTYRKHIRSQFAEGLLSNAVLVTEEQSIIPWITGLSHCLSGQTVEGGLEIEPFDHLGIAVISSEGNGSLVSFCEIIEAASIPVSMVVDSTKKKNPAEPWIKKDKPSFPLPYNGLEDLLSAELPLEKLRLFTVEPEVIDSKLKSEKFDALDEAGKRKVARNFLAGHKGDIPYQEWMMSNITVDTAPPTLLKVIAHALTLVKGASNSTDEEPPKAEVA